MNTIQNKRAYLYLALAGVIGGALTIGQVWAAGLSPSTGIAALTYSGTLEDDAGHPLSGTYNIQVSLWAAPAVSASMKELSDCQAQRTSVSVKSDGKFEVQLRETCAAAIRNNSAQHVYAGVTVDGLPLERTKVGTVPFAVSAIDATYAASAANATNATNGAARVDASASPPSTKPAKVCSGATVSGTTSWTATSTTLISTAVDITPCGFTSVPVVTTSLSGDTGHWLTTGGSQPLSITNKGFKLNVSNAAGITPTAANTNKWIVNWIAVGS